MEWFLLGKTPTAFSEIYCVRTRRQEFSEVALFTTKKQLLLRWNTEYICECAIALLKVRIGRMQLQSVWVMSV